MPGRKPFRLATVLRIRRLQEDIKGQALAKVCRDIHVTEQQHAELVQQQRRALEQAGRVAHQEFDAGDVQRYYVYERYLARSAVEKDAEIAQLRELEVQRRGELEEAMKRRRTVELLEGRYLQAFHGWLRKELQRVSDESATNQAAVRRLENRNS